MKISFILAIWLMSCNGHAQPLDQRVRVFLDEQSTTYSEPVPIKLFGDDLKGGKFPDPGNNAITFNSVKLGVGYRGFTLGYFLREDYALNFTDDTFNLIYMDKNDLEITDGQSFDIYLHAMHLKSAGLNGAFKFSAHELFNVTIGMNAFHAEELLNGDIRGTLMVNDGKIAGDLRLDYYHQEDYVLGREVRTIAEGKGYSFDVVLELQITNHLRLAYSHFDLLGKILWRRAPRTAATVSSTTIYADAEGHLHRAPAMSGRSSYGNAVQSLPKHSIASLIYSAANKFTLSYIGEQYEKVLFNRVLIGYPVVNAWSAKAGYDFSTEAVWLGAESDVLSFDLSTDNMNLAKSKVVVLNVRAAYYF